MDACKLSASREGRKVEFDLLPGEARVLGRSRDCDVVLKDPEVSRQHCRVQAEQGRVLVTDLGSTHGIVYRGQRVQVLEIELGDGFHVGHTFVRFDAIQHATPPAPAASASAATIPLDGPRAADNAVEASPFAATHVGQPGELAPGQRLGAFTITAVLGRSDRGTVYAAEQPSLQRSVALKVLQAQDGAGGDAERAAFHADARANAEELGGALVPVLDAGTDGPHAWIAQERVAGTPLAATLQAGQRMRWQDLLPVLADAAQALQRVHERGQVHGAVKPANVFVTTEGGARLADLRAGTALRPRESTAYAAPELLRGEAIDAPADVYALGCVAYALLQGKPAYWGSPKQILDEVRARRPAALTAVDATLPGSLESWILDRMLAIEPAHRPTAAACHAFFVTAAAPAAGPAIAPAPVAYAAAPAPAAPAPEPAPAPAPRATPIAPRASSGEPMMRRPASSAKSFAARLTADTIIFAMVSAVLIALLLALKAATGFDLYASLGVGAR